MAKRDDLMEALELYGDARVVSVEEIAHGNRR